MVSTPARTISFGTGIVPTRAGKFTHRSIQRIFFLSGECSSEQLIQPRVSIGIKDEIGSSLDEKT